MTNHQQPVYVVDGARTPFLKFRGKPGPFAAADLAVFAGRAVLNRLPISPDLIDEVVLGCMMPSPDEANIARIVAVRLGCPIETPGWTVQRNCGSGLQAVDCAYQAIANGRYQCVLAGGTETMSRAPLLWQPSLVNWYADFARARGMLAKLKQLKRLKMRSLAPIIALERGLTDPLIGMNMGQTIEQMASDFDISRIQMDTYAVQSHHRLAAAAASAHLSEIVPIYDAKGRCYAADDGVRADTNTDLLSTLRPYIERPYGIVTAGNSSQITDGAAVLCLASESFVKEHQLPVLGKIMDATWAAGDPGRMGLGPVWASTQLLMRQQMTLSDVDYWEINEAFAGQVLACLHAWEDADYCQTVMGLSAPLGRIDNACLNVDGGAIALGHPVGATGARIVLHLLHTLKRESAKRGVATLCIGGGQGGAMLLELD